MYGWQKDNHQDVRKILLLSIQMPPSKFPVSVPLVIHIRQLLLELNIIYISKTQKIIKSPEAILSRVYVYNY